MKDHSWDIAVRIKGKAYFLDGANIADFGDANGTMGFCNAIRKAEVLQAMSARPANSALVII